MKYQILHGDNRETLKTLPDNSVDAIVTDPPYGIDFLGKAWDANTGALETYQQCLRVLKPGGHILAFSAARTYHHLAVTLEAAGFEIRDQIMWIYSSGFPKSQDIGRSIQRSLGVEESEQYDSNPPRVGGQGEIEAWTENNTKGKVKITDPVAKQWEGWGTALKPAHEPIALARKPIKLSIAKNCQTHGVGALNIDATRVPYDDPAEAEAMADWYAKYPVNQTGGAPVFQGSTVRKKHKPAAGKRTASFHNATGGGETQSGGDGSGGWEASQIGRFPSNVVGEIPDYQKYFYCPKVSQKERMEFNNHPTVKPIELMKYLIKLITPPGGTVLDPFTGSGSTGCAAVELGSEYIGCELDAAYVEIATKRIEAWYAHVNPTTYNQIFEDKND